MHDQVKEYYGKTLTSSEDLQTNACCTDSSLSPSLKVILSRIHGEVLSRYYGCGLITPEFLQDCTVLDLGCGAGRDVYAIAQMVGEQGRVIGVDMTAEQLAVAQEYKDYHREVFGFENANTEFKHGYIEKLDELGIADNSVDVIVSNCVINLSPDKEAVLKQAYRLLKPGGEMYFSDVYADRRIPDELAQDALLYGECLSGALYWQDFENLAKNCGFTDSRIVESRAITIDNPEITKAVGDIKFTSVTYRLFKAIDVEAQGQDYAQQLTYLGTIAEHQDEFIFDKDFVFKKDLATSVCGNTYQFIKQSRFACHFSFSEESGAHQGLFTKQDQLSGLDFLEAKVETSDKASSCCAPKTSCC